jgi:anti-sigma B factor antagonist
LSIATSKIGSVHTVAPRFPVIEENIARLEQEIQGSFQGGIVQILIDFSEVSHIDSTGLEYLLDSVEEAQKRGGNVKLCNLNQLCKDILLATRLNNVFEIYDEVKEATRSYF